MELTTSVIIGLTDLCWVLLWQISQGRINEIFKKNSLPFSHDMCNIKKPNELYLIFI